MPELPEVEVTRRGLLSTILGRTITHVKTSNKTLRTPVPRALLNRCIRANRIDTVDRRAKYLLFRMADGAVLQLHLGMTGRIGLFTPSSGQHRHDHLCLGLGPDLELRFNDSRRFGSIQVWPPEQATRLERQFNENQGLEPLDKDFGPELLLPLAASSHIPIKLFLMDGRKIAGIGNIYANESLFLAGIHPETPTAHVPPLAWHRLVDAIRTVLDRAIAAGGTTIADFLGSSGQPGYFQLELKVYGQAGTACSNCGTEIERIRLGGRATYFCPHCQAQPYGPSLIEQKC